MIWLGRLLVVGFAGGLGWWMVAQVRAQRARQRAEINRKAAR